MGIENLLAQGYRSNIEPYGNALMRAQEFKTAQQRNALMQMQGEDLHAQRGLALEQAKLAAADRARMEQWRESIPSPQMGAGQQALSGGGGPTVANAARIPAVDPRLQALHGGMRAGAVTPMDYINAANPKDEFVTVAPGASRINARTNQVGYTAPFKPEAQKLPAFGELQTYRDTLPPGDPRRREVDALIANQTRPPKYAGGGGGGGGGAPKPAKPLPPAALKMQQESLDKIGIASSINADLSGIRQQIEQKKLDFGPVSNLFNTGRNMAGMSTEQSRNFGSFKSTLERLRNESLRLNTGVQTDGDAQRAWNELFQNINDTGLVKQRLAEIEAINKRGADLQRLRVESIRNEYGAGPLDASGYSDQAPAIGAPGSPPKPSGGKPSVSNW